MDAQELADELGQPGAQELLDSTAAHLAYDGPDGFPRVIPVGFLWKAGRIIVCTATTSPKAAALSSRPNVAVAIDVGDSPEGAKSLLIRGIASMETVDGVADEYIEMSTKSMDAEQQAEFEREVRKVYKQQVRIRSSRNGRGSSIMAQAACRSFLRSSSTTDQPDAAERTAQSQPPEIAGDPF